MKLLLYLVPFAVIFGIVWITTIAPARKKDAETTAMRDNVTIGDIVVTQEGIIGEVIDVNELEQFFVIKTDPDGLIMHIKRWGINAVNPEFEEDDEEEDTAPARRKAKKRTGTETENAEVDEPVTEVSAEEETETDAEAEAAAENEPEEITEAGNEDDE
jgi:preprotein translocase YajC subunit